MLLVTFARWQLPDLSFTPTVTDLRNVPGPPGLIIVNQLAWLCDWPQRNSFYYRGYAHVRRLFITGWIDCRLLGFTGVPCPNGPRMHMKVDWVYVEDGSSSGGDGGIAPDEMVQRGPWCVPLIGVDEEGSQPCFFEDSDSSSSDDDGVSPSGDDDGATPYDDGDDDCFAAAAA